MKIKPVFLVLFLLVIGSLLSACSGAAFIPSGWPEMTIANGVAYLADNQFVYAVQIAADKGTELWRYPAKADASKTFFSAPVLTPDNQLLVGSYNYHLYSLNPENGQENNFSFQAKDRIIASPLATDQGIFVPSADHTLYSLDSAGKVLWTYKSEGPLWSSPIAGKNCECIYQSSMDHHIYALSTKNGNVLWGQKVDLGSSIVGTPVLSADGSTIYMGTFGSQMVAIDAQNGEIRWRKSVSGWVWAGPALNNDGIYFGDLNGDFYALNASSGNLLWSQPYQSDGVIVSTPLVISQSVYFTTDAGTVYALDLSGKTSWNPVSIQVGGKGNIYTSPAASSDLLLIAPSGIDAKLIALSATNGTSKWSFVPAK